MVKESEGIFMKMSSNSWFWHNIFSQCFPSLFAHVGVEIIHWCTTGIQPCSQWIRNQGTTPPMPCMSVSLGPDMQQTF